jgi:hypothetical protein
MRDDRWDILADVAEEDSARHHLVRGRRVANSPQSDALRAAARTSDEIQRQFVNQMPPKSSSLEQGSKNMPYDIGMERFSRDFNDPPRYHNTPVPAKDLETLMTLLEVAALSLTSSPDATFTLEELLNEARDIGGEGISIEDLDANIVLEKVSFLKKGGGRLSLR